MSLTSRILPAEEWWRLAGTELDTVWETLPPEKTTVIVVENEDGLIVGTWSIFSIVHTEGLGVAPAYRGRGRVARLLLKTGAALMREMGVTSFVTGAVTDEMAQYLTRMQAQEIPVRFFAVPIAGQMSRVTKE